MSNQTFNYYFNISGNAQSAVPSITASVENMTDKVKQSVGVWDSLQGKIVVFNQLSQFVERFGQTVQNTLKPGADLNASMADLAAISGETGEGLKTIEHYARESAKTFGGSAARSVEAYKLLLSQLSPELTKTPAALRAMGDNIMYLSKTMGGDTTAAAEVLTTAMNQYGVSLKDPMRASKEMAVMMNVMAAAGKEGSAELPTIKLALEQAGMAAKAAGVSFVETNAAIQVLDKAGKKGSEGGVALRNVMTTLARGRFLPKDIQKELQAAGVDMNKLTDKTLSLTDRLRLIQPILNDTALLSKLFGRENMNAALALVQGIDEVDRYAEAIEGTNTAFEQAEIIMESYNEKRARIQATFDDFRISIFNATGDFGVWVEVVTGALTPLSQLVPLIWGIAQGMMWVKNLNWAGMWSGINRAILTAQWRTALFNRELIKGQFASIGFTGNIMRATVGIIRFATVGLFNGLKALGAFILSLVTGGTASATFAGIASTAFGVFKTAAVSACRAVSIAIKSIPVIGWIIAIISAIGALFAYFWRTSAKFRATMKGVWAFFVASFKGIWDVAKNVFSAIGDIIISALKFDGKGIKAAVNKMKNGFADAGAAAGRAYQEAYDAEMERSRKAEEEKDNPLDEFADYNIDTSGEDNPISGGLSGIGGAADKADKIKNIVVSIEQLIGKFEVHTTNLREDTSRVKDMVAEALVGAVNDLNYAM